MKHTMLYLLLVLCTLTSTALFAQDNHNKARHEKVEAAKIAYLTDKMKLTPEQAQKFWPLYNTYETTRRGIYTSSRSSRKTPLEQMSEQEIKAMIDRKFVRDQQVLDLEKEYASEFMKVISTRQLAQLYRSEHEFTKLLLRRLDGPNTRKKD